MFRDRKTILDVTPDWEEHGIFSALESFDIPWGDLNISGTLDDLFYTSYGERLISPYLTKHLTNGSVSQLTMNRIAQTLYYTCGGKWSKLYAVWSYEYDPIQNYSMREQMTNDTTATIYGKSQTRTDNLSHTKTGTEQNAPNVTQTETPNTTETRTDNLTQGKSGSDTLTHNVTDQRTDNLTHAKTGTEENAPNTTETQTPNLTQTTNVYGFNSSAAQPAGSQGSSGTNTTTKTGTETLTHNTTDTDTGTSTNAKTGTEQTTYNTSETQTGTVTNAKTGTVRVEKTGTETLTYNTTDADSGTQTVADSGQDSTVRNYVLTRSGNIGVTTSQQMIQSEIDLWKWNFFETVVIPDLLNLLALPIY